MRVVYFTDTRVIGGAERSLADLAGGVLGAGHEALLLAPQRELVEWLRQEVPGAEAERALADSYHDAPSPARRASALLRALPRLALELRRHRPDVVHVNNGGFPGSDLCRIAPLAAMLAGVSCRVMTVHSNPWTRERLADPQLQAAADRLVWSSLSAVVSPSRAVEEGLRARRGMPRRLGRTIYYGVPRSTCDPGAATKLRRRLAPQNQLLAGMVSARPVPEKGYDVFVEALAEAGERVRGVLVGQAPEDLAARAHAAGVGDRLALEGPRRNVGDYHGAFDVLVVPSTAEECMPLVILEAASLGTPAFGSRLSGIPEAIADGASGRLFTPGAKAELAELLRAGTHERDRIAAMGQAAARRWSEQFEIDAMVGKTLRLYGELLPGLRARPALEPYADAHAH
ncbi:MAG TPA: glycosyltransferase family 4 protein [Solirubrobacteraceae bacterium]